MSNHRFAITGLSRENKANAYNEEILIEKNTGQFLIKNKAGQIISYDSLARLNEHINKMTYNAENVGIKGSLNEIELDHLELPYFVENNIDLIKSNTFVVATKARNVKLLLSVDLEKLTTGSVLKLATTPAQIIIAFEARNKTNSAVVGKFTVTTDTDKLPTLLIQPELKLTGVSDKTVLDNCNLLITSVKAVAPTTPAVRLLLHSMLIAIETI